MRLRDFFIGLLSFIYIAFGMANFLCAEVYPRVTPGEVKQYREAHESAWMGKFKMGESRLFYTQEEWRSLVSRVEKADGIARQWRDKLISAAEFIVTEPLPSYLPPSAYMAKGETKATAEQELWMRLISDDLAVLAFVTRMKPEPRYEQRLRELVLAVCKFETWGRFDKHKNDDLAAGQLAHGIAMAYDWNRRIFTEDDRKFIHDAMKGRMADMMDGLYGKIFWSKEYTANHNHISVAGLGMAGVAFLGEIPEAGDWLAAAMVDYERVMKACAEDGSSVEGLGYWSYGVSFMLTFIEGARNVAGSDIFYKSSYLRQGISYRLGCSTPGFYGVLRWGDATGKDYFGPHHILYRLAAEYRDSDGQYLADNLPFTPVDRGSRWLDNSGRSEPLLWSLLWRDPALPSEPPRKLDYHATVLDVFTTRNKWETDGYLFSIKSGINNDHHTHLDAGSISLCVRTAWLIQAPGYGEGRVNKDFWDRADRRWNYFSTVTESHSALVINGKRQRIEADAGGTIERIVSGAESSWVEVNLDKAYDVKDGSVRRMVLHRRNDYLLVLDQVSSPEPVSVEWLAQVPPQATSQGSVIFAMGERGDAAMKLTLLGEKAAPFVDRKPKSPINDVPAKILKTYSSSSLGDEVRFSALIQPNAYGKEPGRLSSEVENSPSGRKIAIAGDGWLDEVVVLKKSGDLGRVKSLPEASGIGRVWAVRKEENGLISILGCEMKSLSLTEMKWNAEKPFDLMIEGDGKGVWMISLATPFQGIIQLADGMSVFSEKGEKVSVGKNGTASLAEGQWQISKSYKNK